MLYSIFASPQGYGDFGSLLDPKANKQQTVTTYELMDWADVPVSKGMDFPEELSSMISLSLFYQESVKSHFRKKEAQRKSKEFDKTKTTCMLYLQADHLVND